MKLHGQAPLEAPGIPERNQTDKAYLIKKASNGASSWSFGAWIELKYKIPLKRDFVFIEWVCYNLFHGEKL